MDREQRRQLKRERSGKFGRGPIRVNHPKSAEVLQGSFPVIWIEPTGVERYHRGYHCRAEGCNGYAEEQMPAEAIEEYRKISAPHWQWPEPRPTISCPKCAQPIEMNSAGVDAEMHAPSTGEVFERLRDLPVGAVWAMPGRGEGRLWNWLSYRDEDGQPFPPPEDGQGKRCRHVDRPHPSDGRVLICRLPDGTDWVIDSRANNCDMPLDDEHWCWNRTGRPEDGSLHVTKGAEGQTTCGAGAGSIQTGRWHGFLHHGVVKP